MSIPAIHSIDNSIETIIKFIKAHQITDDNRSVDNKKLLDKIVNIYMINHGLCDFNVESSVSFLSKLTHSKFFKYINEYIDVNKISTIDTGIREILDEFAAILNGDCKSKNGVCDTCGDDKSLDCIDCVVLLDTCSLVEQKVDYQPLKHCSDWIDRIQGREKVVIPDEVITRIKSVMTKSRISTCDLTCASLRKILKVKDSSGKNLTKYNNSVVLLRKMITGEQPALLTQDEINMTRYQFQRAIDTFNSIRGPNDSASCHSYLIYKILEFILPTSTTEDVNRRRSILSTIHKQSRDTTMKNDIMWKRICDILGDIKYVVTQL